MRPLPNVKVTSSTIDNHEELVQAGPLTEANPFGVSLGGRGFKPVDISRGSAVSDNDSCVWGPDAKKKLGTLSVKAKQRCRWAWGQRCTDGWSGASWSVNQSCVRFQAIPATTVAATIVSAAIQAVTTENALIDLTTLATMVGGACTESTSKSIFLPHNPHFQIGFTGCSFRQLRCDECGCAVSRHPCQLPHLDSASAVFGDNGWHAGRDHDDKIDLAGSEGLDGMKADNTKPRRWSGLKYFGTHEYADQLLVDAGNWIKKGSDDASVEPETVRIVLGVLDHGLP